MDIEQLLLESLQLLGLGMGAVFVILMLLILLITIVSRLVPEETTPSVSLQSTSVNKDHIAAIAAAIHLHRKRR